MSEVQGPNRSEVCDFPGCEETDIYLRVQYEGWPVAYNHCKEHSPAFIMEGELERFDVPEGGDPRSYMPKPEWNGPK